MNNEVVKALRDMRALIEKPEHWTKGAAARHANGNPIGPMQENATCWCMIGALERVAPKDVLFDAVDAIKEFLPKGKWIADFNDDPNTSQADVLAVIDRAIAAQEAGQ